MQVKPYKDLFYVADNHGRIVSSGFRDKAECETMAKYWHKSRADMIADIQALRTSLKNLLNVPVLPDPGHEDQLIKAINNAQTLTKE